MKFCLRIVLLLFLVTGTLTDELNLFDALDDGPTPSAPKEQPKAPEKPKSDDGFGFNLEDAFGPDPTPKPDKPAVKPPSGGGGGFNLEDAFGPDPTPKPNKPAVKPPSGGGGGLDLEDALGPDPNPKPDKPVVKPPSGGGGGGTFDDGDLFDVTGGDYKPEGGRPGGGHAVDPGHDPQGGADQPQDPDLLWGQILKLLNDNMPEEFYMWISNVKKTVIPLLERAMDLLQAIQ